MRWALLLVVGSLLAGCKSDEKKDVPVAPKTDTKEQSASSKASEVSDEDLKKLSASVQTEEDFEDQVGKQITADNLEAELSKLEKEIDAENPDAPSAPNK